LVELYDLPADYCYLFDVLNKSEGEDINRRTVSLELLGSYFDDEGHPSPQLIANAAGTIVAYVKKYPEIKFANITGHFEIQMDKADPGKRFMAELRLILTLKVLQGDDEKLKDNLFSPFIKEGESRKDAIKRFLDFHWDYLVSSNWNRSLEVNKWEEEANYWNIYQKLFPENATPLTNGFILPVTPTGNKKLVIGNEFAEPQGHEGIDLNLQETRRIINEDLGSEISATANGKVIFADTIPGTLGLGRTIAIEHIVEGTKVISIYSHLEDILVEKGDTVNMGKKIATMGNSGGQMDSHLHFAILPAATKRQKEFSHYLQLKYRGEDVDPYQEIENGRVFIVRSTTRREDIETSYFSPLPFIAEHKAPDYSSQSLPAMERKLQELQEE
jgi:murein DD-endopeptidase MepM/ murein hydrolase activator NlpD